MTSLPPAQVCLTLGISEQHYERWCREFGATRKEREQKLVELRRENTRLRKLVAEISLERDALREALNDVRPRARSEGPVPPNLTVVANDSKGGKG